MARLERAYALIIGVGKDLPVTVRDAQAVNDILLDETYAGYLPENIILLTESDAKREDILRGFKDLISRVDEDSSVLIYYSGHGGTYLDNDILFEDEKVPESKNKRHFYIQPNDFDAENFDETWVTADELKSMIQQIKSRRLVFFLDCCHAQGMTKELDLSSDSTPYYDNQKPDAMAQNIEDGQGISIISSCREDQLSYIMEGDNNSLFTRCLVEVLQGKHKSTFIDPFIRITEVTQYIFKKVPEVKPEQRPFVNLQIYDDFILSSVPAEMVQSGLREVETAVKEKNVPTLSFRKTENANNVILFVHGFTGESSSTFGEIPSFLMKDERFDGWDFYPVGLTENITPNLGRNVWASETELDMLSDFIEVSIKNKYSSYDRVAIVAHGIGGIATQKAILQMDEKTMKRLTHVLLFGSPNSGIKESVVEQFDNRVIFLSENGDYIQNIRKGWDGKFGEGYPFDLKVIAGTSDQFVPLESNLDPFRKEYQALIMGDHWSVTKPESIESDSYRVIVDTILNNEFYNIYTSKEEINIALGEYKTVVDELLPKVNEIGINGFKMLCFALEGLDRENEVLEIIKDYPSHNVEADIISMLAGRLKRKYLLDHQKKNADESYTLYTKSLSLAKDCKNCQDVYYNAINLAFLSLVANSDLEKMREYAHMAEVALGDDAIDSLWKLATLGECALYKGEFENAKSYYKKASVLAGIREKVSMYTNASIAYQALMGSKTIDDEFMRFLNYTLL